MKKMPRDPRKGKNVGRILAPQGQRVEPKTVRIFDIDIPLPTLDANELQNACVQPVYNPGIVVVNGRGERVVSPDGQTGQVVTGHMPGFNGGQALIIRETSMALDGLREEIRTLRMGMRACLQISEELARQAQIGQDGLTRKRIKGFEDDIRDLRLAFFPDDPDPAPELST